MPVSRSLAEEDPSEPLLSLMMGCGSFFLIACLS